MLISGCFVLASLEWTGTKPKVIPAASFIEQIIAREVHLVHGLLEVMS